MEKSKSEVQAVPFGHGREPAGEHVLFMAGIRSKLAKNGGDALSDLEQGDVDRTGRYPAPAEIGTGGELVPTDPGLRDTVTNPDYVTVDASRDRLALANRAGALELALDASDTADPKNSLEKMLVHQMAVLHRQTMKLAARMDDFSLLPLEGLQQRSVEVCRLGATVARLAAAYQSALLALQRARSGGRQVVTVQHVHVGDGGQAVVAAKNGTKGGGG